MELRITVWYPDEVQLTTRFMTELSDLRESRESPLQRMTVEDPDGSLALADIDRKEALRIERDALDGKMEPIFVPVDREILATETPVEDVKPLVALYVKKHSVNDLKALLQSEFGVARVTEVPSDKTAQLIGLLKEGLA